ncbi:MAG: NOB1 family endonuclease [Candidatus Jordarchaeaceae archaeon]
MSRRKIIILDTSAFVAGFTPSTVDLYAYSVQDVERELKDSLALSRFQAALKAGKLKILNPEPYFVEEVKEISKETGDRLYLSEADLHVLALAIQLKNKSYSPILVTDDYSMQNVATKMGIKFASLATLGIKYYLKWLVYCPACRHKYPTDHKNKYCKVCGTKLKIRQ